jgi:membrane associated rhomboid family serine protease
MRFVQALPLGIILLLIPSWVSYLLIDERDDFDTENPLYLHVPDITQDPVQLVISLIITPVINTEGDQILLVTGLLLIFGSFVEKRLGAWRMFAIFWGASICGALLGGLLLHVLYPLFPDVEVFHTGWRRIFNGGSAGGFGLLAAFAATSKRWWIWVGIFTVWEPTFWATISQDYTSVFHIIAFLTGFLMARRFRQQLESEGRRGETEQPDWSTARSWLG